MEIVGCASLAEIFFTVCDPFVFLFKGGYASERCLFFFIVLFDFVTEFLEGEGAFCADCVLLAKDCVEGLEFFVKICDSSSFAIHLFRKTCVQILEVKTRCIEIQYFLSFMLLFERFNFLDDRVGGGRGFFELFLR